MAGIRGFLPASLVFQTTYSLKVNVIFSKSKEILLMINLIFFSVLLWRQKNQVYH